MAVTPNYSPAEGYGATAPGGYNYVQNSSTGGTWSQTPASQLPSTGSTLDLNTDGGLSGGAGSTGDPLDLSGFSGGPSPSEGVNGGPSEQDIINQEFNDFNNYLNNEEGAAKSNFAETKGLYDTQFANASGQLKTEQGDQTRDIKGKETLDLKRVRQLLSDLGQRDAARTAITGGGSVSEALAERFGREAQSRLGNVQEQTRSALTRVNTFYNNALVKLQENYTSATVGARQNLEANLREISRSRDASATAKQRATLDAWRNFYQNVNQAKIQAANFKVQYDMWKQGQDNQLAATSGFNMSNLGVLDQGTSQSLQPLGEGVQTQQNQTQNINPNLTMQPGQDDEDEFIKSTTPNYQALA